MRRSTPSPVAAERPTQGNPGTCCSLCWTARRRLLVSAARRAGGTRSSLFSTSKRPRPSSTTSEAMLSSRRVTPSASLAAASASTTSATVCANRMLRWRSREASFATAPPTSSNLSSRISRIHPAVSTRCTLHPSQPNSAATASRVSPGSGPVRLRSSPMRRLHSVDFPTLGRPTTARRSGCALRSPTSAPIAERSSSLASGLLLPIAESMWGCMAA
mmetsp:Transcript_10873/g.25832  ORF Transcript_10873/g.25832 Transcript_10873/m.25832 type:complete len:217 (-) Transcript_10873:877-1527(-)